MFLCLYSIDYENPEPIKSNLSPLKSLDTYIKEFINYVHNNCIALKMNEVPTCVIPKYKLEMVPASNEVHKRTYLKMQNFKKNLYLVISVEGN